MAEIGIKALKAHASEIVSDVEEGNAYVVTRRGRPAAVILPIDEAEDVVLANADDFIKMRRRARSDHRQGRSIPIDELD